MYSIYKITSPSGRFYIGVTNQNVMERWRQHTVAAKTRPGRHPFRAAIRKYGIENFTVETLATTEDEAEALALEVRFIQDTRANRIGYNISAGGEYDWETGVNRLRELRKDPEFDRRYRAALSAGVRASEKSRAWSAGGLAEMSAVWRKDNPKEVWRIAHRASRLAARAAGVPPHVKRDHRFGKASGRLWIGSEKVANARGALGRSARAVDQWAFRSAEERQAVSAAISKAIKENHDNKTPEEKQAHFSQLAEARKNINHDLRKARQREAFAARNAIRDAGLTPEQKERREKDRAKRRERAMRRYYAKKAAKKAAQ